MKPLLMRHSEPINESFKVWKNGTPYRHNPWHYHPECEITYIYKGKGILFIGDQMIDYGDDEVIMMGPNLPHEFRSDIEDSPDLYSQSVSIHFDQLFLGEKFYQLPEVISINELLFDSLRGVRVNNHQTKHELKRIFIQLTEAQGMPKIYLILQLLHILAKCRNLDYLSSNSFANSFDKNADDRINKVYQYVMKNFTNSISTPKVASLINMTPTSFCRFFKERTHKQFIQYVTEIRVGYACRLLLEGTLTIAQVAYSSGFGNLSHFNKQFKTVKGITPSQFLKGYLKVPR